MNVLPIAHPWLFAAALSIALSANGMAFAQTAVAETLSLSGKVVSVDMKTRHVTLRGPKGNETTVKAGDDVKHLDQVKPGDTVSMDYMRELVVELQPTGDVGASAEDTVERSPKGAPPEVVSTQRTTITARIVAIDNEKHTVTLQGPRGNKRTLDVEDPEWQAKLATLKPGQLVSATYTEAVAVALTKPGAAKKP